MATANIGFLGSLVGSKTHGSLEGYPMATMEYFASTEECLEDGGGDPIFLMSPLQAALQNVFEDNRVSLGVRSPQPQSSLPIVDARFSLVGKLEPLNETMAELVKPCYMRAHPEAKWAYAAHDFKYWVLRVDEVYYVGGFGGEHYIGWIDQETWGSARRGKHDGGGLVYQQT
ncbi:hypothetical protein SAICODRAFT_8304 [Saitoella complicata NRRL Y-17804]|nr:uncharacterized protein SAICODRAFT_8304 [Saitoella complicata NRRL Y-17804]ODQ52086.1 hypothetical protein SAICODRAFT_8304 [Saitoella complicata NRRL Y-17804]